MSIQRNSIVQYLNEYLKIRTIKDSSCNGLQVQGPESVTRIGLAVDACMASYRKAAAQKCEMLIVHHGLIWNGLTSITGAPYNHIKYLFDHGINLYGAHLPLDLHPVVGNNAQLAAMIGLTNVKPFGEYHGMLIGCKGVFAVSRTPGHLAKLLKTKLGHDPLLLPFGPAHIRSVGIISGGAAAELAQAIGAKLDCYITGESSHWNHHAALEAGINVLYGGHYATETVGVKALGKLLEKKFKVKTVFLDEPTGV